MENYEKLYKEALERAKLSRLRLSHIGVEASEIEYIFPELKESEDEKIRKAIINFLINVNNGAYTKSELEIASWIAWLEKQGKSKWSEEDDYNVQCCIAKAESDIANGCPGRNKELIDWLKSLKQRMEEQQ